MNGEGTPRSVAAWSGFFFSGRESERGTRGSSGRFPGTAPGTAEAVGPVSGPVCAPGGGPDSSGPAWGPRWSLTRGASPLASPFWPPRGGGGHVHSLTQGLGKTDTGAAGCFPVFVRFAMSSASSSHGPTQRPTLHHGHLAFSAFRPGSRGGFVSVRCPSRAMRMRPRSSELFGRSWRIRDTTAYTRIERRPRDSRDGPSNDSMS